MSGTLDNATSWLPIGESPLDIQEDATNLIGPTTINGFTFGIAFTLYVICVQSLVQQLRAGTRPKQTIFTLVYISVMFAMATIYCAVNSRLVQLEFVNFRNYPGGPTAYSIVLFPTAINIAGLCAFFITNWMNDALLLWRLWILYHRSRFQLPVIGFGTLLYLATFAIGIIVVVESSLPNDSFFTGIAVEFVTTYYALTTSFTIIITLLMSARILLVRRQLISATGSQAFAAQYTSIVSMLVESSALYTVWGIIFLATYVTNNPVQNIFLASLSEIQTIAPLLIVYRVSQGKAWNYDTTKTLTAGSVMTGRFRAPGASTTATATPTMDAEMKAIRIQVQTDVDSRHVSTHFKDDKGVFGASDASSDV
ncbi:hypothetical protein CVT24_012587 [Panaeolus cyanescens]|uniref:G-protein coupled receptors family 1 profile domain-containing protein n=1 Tax=Panaeolus cyanescens TaxID=181874 RepID=A0A409YJX6_9AGAR|nr:hypothetical protein CVT24_012587 [Panaeolus cyanescens]